MPTSDALKKTQSKYTEKAVPARIHVDLHKMLKKTGNIVKASKDLADKLASVNGEAKLSVKADHEIVVDPSVYRKQLNYFLGLDNVDADVKNNLSILLIDILDKGRQHGEIKIVMKAPQ